MKNFIKKNWILILIIIVAAILRLWKLGNVPPGLTQDEAALGYNAYSILKTGHDEYGKFLPVIFKSFGDYKPGLYVYLDIPFVAAFGLNPVSTRLPSAIAGVISVWLIYLIVVRLFEKKRLGIIAAFVASITPWAIYVSRGAWEVNIALTLTLSGIYFFFRSFKKHKFLILSSVFFALTLITYQGAKLSTLIVLVILTVVYFENCRKFFVSAKKELAISVVAGLIIVSPIIVSLLTGQTGRLDVFSVFSYPRPASYTQSFLNEGGEKIGDINYYLFHSEALNFTRGILGRWFNHFSGKFLFFVGDYQNPGHSAPYQGMLLVTDFIVLAVGLFSFFKNYTLSPKPYTLILLWLIFSPLPAVLSRDQVQSIRALNMVVPLVVILSLGLNEIINWLSVRVDKRVVILILFTFYFLPFTYFLDAYYIHVPKHNSNYWNYGYKQVVEKVDSMENQDRDVIVEQSYAQPYIYFLYYSKYDPAKYQKQANLVQSANINDVGFVQKLGSIRFQDIDWSVVRNDHGAIVVVDYQTPIPQDLSYDTIDEIKFLNGRDLAFSIIKIK